MAALVHSLARLQTDFILNSINEFKGSNMTTDRHHGVTSIETVKGIRPISALATNAIGVIVTGDDADVTALPLDTPVFSTSARALAKFAGKTGTIAAVLDGITDQADAPIVLVRVAEAPTEPEQSALVIGSDTAGKLTGLKALAAAKTLLGVEPKIIGCPGLDTQGVTAELVVTAQTLNAMGYAKAIGATLPEVAAYRENFSQRELMLIDGEFTRISPITGEVERAMTIAIAMGLRAKIDSQTGWHKTLSNVGVNGVVGIETPRSFSLINKDTDANFLNNADITTLVREEGFRFWGNRTCSDEPMFAFESSTRGAQIIRQRIASAMMWAIDKPMTPTLIEDILLSVNSDLAKDVRDGKLYGARVFVRAEENTKSEILLGKFRVGYEFTIVMPLENLVLEQVVSDTFIVNLVDRVVAIANDILPTTV